MRQQPVTLTDDHVWIISTLSDALALVADDGESSQRALRESLKFLRSLTDADLRLIARDSDL